MGRRFSITLKVRFYETDPYNHVNNAVYLFYFDHARDEYFEQALAPYPEMRGDAVRYVVARAEVDYLAPAGYGDVLEIAGEVSQLGRTSLTFDQRMTRPRDGVEIARSRTVLVWCGPDNRPAPVPDVVRQAFA